ncbi:MAG: helix-turn-helix domain-containing protein [Bacillus sp. (in: Bacteria)]|nr:helix-turn-helix domain-containing protein [Bacillus sp. (in: firmicutes)]
MNGHRLKIMRTEKELSLSKLSKLTGISKSYLSLIERGIQRNPSLVILEKIAKSLEVDIDYLVNKEKSEKEICSSGKHQVKSTLKFEIELTPDQLNLQKIKQIKELINSLVTDG